MRPALAAIALAIVAASCSLPGRDARRAFAPPLPQSPSELDCTPLSLLNDSDGDFARVDASTLSALCASVTRFSDVGRDWTVQRLHSGRPGPLWIVPHDDENSAFASGVAAVSRYGGILVAVESSGQRNNGPRDPNRIFGLSGRCRGAGAGPVAPTFTAELLRYRFAGQPVVALHNNMPGYENDGAHGQGNVSILLDARHRTAFPAPAPYPESASPSDTLVYVAGERRTPGAATAQLIARLNGAGIHVLYEHVAASRSDCSLSNFALLAGIAPYVNIEVVKEDTATQTRLIDDVMRILAAGSWTS
ncbi:MAG: hypothetical protein ACREH4_13205 [Vitreimonas sp.]